MTERLDVRLMKASERIRLKRKLEAMLRQTHAHSQIQRSKRSALKARLEEEKSDVEKLEGLGLTALFYSVLGNKQEKLDKELEEFLAAKLQHDEADAELKDVERELQRLRDELLRLKDADVEYDGLLREKESRLTEMGDGTANSLLVLSQTLADRTSVSKELNEAMEAGKEAMNSLSQVSEALGSAANWGTWDMLGGGMIATMAKHSKIDFAKQRAQFAQRQLRRFQTELADADQRLQVSLQIDGFSKFADFFFDGLIADWIVQSKIQNASSACATAMSQVKSALAVCRTRLEETEREIGKVTRERQELLEQTPLL